MFTKKSFPGITVISLLFCLVFSIFLPQRLTASEKFYNYYDKGQDFMKKNDWLRAIEEFKSSVSLEFEDKKKKRTYGTRFIEYFPHREMGICYYNLDEYSDAMGELQLSVAYKKSKRANSYIDRMTYDGRPLNLDDEKVIAEVMKADQEAEKEKEKEKEVKEFTIVEKKDTKITSKQKEEKEKEKLQIKTTKVPTGALTYDPNKVTQVGSRLAIAVMPLGSNDGGANLKDTVTQKLVTQLVNLRRFRVIERGAVEEVMKEQAFTLSGMVNEDTAIEVGKLVGADVIIMGSITVEIGFGKVNARGIDIETGETIVAKEATTGNTSIDNIEKLVESVAIMIYNDLPLVEGYIVNVEPEFLYLDIGSDVGVRKGTKCVAFREGETIIHPITKEVLGRKVSKLGELIVIQVQEKLATARILSKEGSIDVGDKVVVK